MRSRKRNLVGRNEKRPDRTSSGICKDVFLDNSGTFETVELSRKKHKNMARIVNLKGEVKGDHKLKKPQQS